METPKQKEIVSKAKQIWLENNLENLLLPAYTSHRDPWGYDNGGGVMKEEFVECNGFTFIKKGNGNKVEFYGSNGEKGEFKID